jgi:hypothetical protein
MKTPILARKLPSQMPSHAKVPFYQNPIVLWGLDDAVRFLISL